MDIKSIIAAGLVAALMSAGTVSVLKPDAARETLGSLASPDVFSYLFVHGVLSEGGGISTITPTSGSHTLTAAQMQDANIITFSASSTMPALTVTLPASTTLPLPAEKGARRRWIIENPFTAAATTTTVAAGTGIDLQIPETTGADVAININNYGLLDCVRGLDSGSAQDIVCILTETIPGD